MARRFHRDAYHMSYYAEQSDVDEGVDTCHWTESNTNHLFGTNFSFSIRHPNNSMTIFRLRWWNISAWKPILQIHYRWNAKHFRVQTLKYTPFISTEININKFNTAFFWKIITHSNSKSYKKEVAFEYFKTVWHSLCWITHRRAVINMVVIILSEVTTNMF